MSNKKYIAIGIFVVIGLGYLILSHILFKKEVTVTDGIKRSVPLINYGRLLNYL